MRSPGLHSPWKRLKLKTLTTNLLHIHGKISAYEPVNAFFALGGLIFRQRIFISKSYQNLAQPSYPLHTYPEYYLE